MVQGSPAEGGRVSRSRGPLPRRRPQDGAEGDEGPRRLWVVRSPVQGTSKVFPTRLLRAGRLTGNDGLHHGEAQHRGRRSGGHLRGVHHGQGTNPTTTETEVTG